MVPPTLTAARSSGVGKLTRVVTSNGSPSGAGPCSVSWLLVTGPMIRSSTTDMTSAWAWVLSGFRSPKDWSCSDGGNGSLEGGGLSGSGLAVPPFRPFPGRPTRRLSRCAPNPGDRYGPGAGWRRPACPLERSLER